MWYITAQVKEPKWKKFLLGTLKFSIGIMVFVIMTDLILIVLKKCINKSNVVSSYDDGPEISTADVVFLNQAWIHRGHCEGDRLAS